MELPRLNARIRPSAAEDLEQIVRYLDKQSATAGDRFLEEFYSAANLLNYMPRIGPVRRTTGPLKGLRSWPLSRFRSYLVFYLPVDTGIEVVRVMHGARDVENELPK